MDLSRRVAKYPKESQSPNERSRVRILASSAALKVWVSGGGLNSRYVEVRMTGAPITSSKMVTHNGEWTTSLRTRPTSPNNLSTTWSSAVDTSGEVPNALTSQVPRTKITTLPTTKQMIAASRLRALPRAWN